MGRPSPAAPPRAPHGEREARRRLGQGQGRRLRGACCLPRASRGPADRGRPRRVRAHRLAPAGNSICWVSGPAGRGLVETVGGFAGSAAGGRGHVRAREDREQAAQTGAGVRSGVRFRQFFEGPQFPYGVQAQAVGEGVRGPVLAGRRAVREPDVADRSAQAGPEHVSGAVDAPPQGEHGPGDADGEGGGPAGQDAVDGLIAVQPRRTLGDEHAPARARAGEQHALAQQQVGGGATDPGSARQSSRAPGAVQAGPAEPLRRASIDMATNQGAWGHRSFSGKRRSPERVSRRVLTFDDRDIS